MRVNVSRSLAKRVLGGIAAATLFAAMPAYTQVQRSFVNPSFESPALTAASNASGCYVQLPSSLVSGWSTTHPSAAGTGSCTNPAAGQTGPLIELWRTNFLGVVARDQTNFAELNAQQSSRIYQSVCFVNGEQINWQFSHRGRSSATVPDVAQMKIGATGTVVEVGTTSNGTFNTPVASQGTVNTPTSGGNGWVDYTGTFSYAGASGVNSLGFESISTANGDNSVGNFLDDIQISLAPFVDFVSASSSATETAGAAGGAGANLPTLRVNGTVATAFTITVKITGGTANGPGASSGTPIDFSTPGNSSTLTVNVPAGIYDGVNSGLFTLPVTIINDSIAEPNKDIQFTIQPPTGSNPPFLLASSATCGSAVQTTWDYTIIDDDGSLALTKTASAPVSVGGSLTQYDITYTIVAKNPTGSSVTYTLSDTPAFDSDVTINSLRSLTCATTGGGTSCSTNVLSTPQNTSGPWTLTPSSRSLGGGRTDTYTMVVRFTINPGQSGSDICGASSGGLFNKITASVPAGNPNSYSSTACQSTPTPIWATLNKQLPTRINSSDQFQVRMSSGGIAVSGGSATTSGTGTTATTGQIVLPAGATLQFSEALKTNGSGADQAPSAYSTVLSCTNTTSGSSTVLPSGSGTAQATQQQWVEFSPAAGDVLNCTITNTLKPATLTLTKTVNNTHGGAATVASFPLTATGPTTITGVSGTAAVTNASVNAGTYTLSEATVAGYTAGSWSCTAGTLTGNSLVLTSGQTATCSITNSDQASTLTLKKTVSNTHGGTKTMSDFPLTATGPTTITGVSGTAAVTSASVNAGTYTLSEPAVAGYAAGSWSCTAGTLTGNSLVIGSGQTATCSITNNDQAATLTLTKTVNNTHGGAKTISDFPLTATGPTTITGVSGTAAVTSAPVNAGTYTLSEPAVAGYTAGTWSCTAGTLTGNSLVLANGQTATCSITNSDQAATLTLTKTVSNTHGGAATVSSFPLKATGPTTITGVSGTAAVTSASVSAGTYTLSETTVAGYTAGSWSCTGGTLTGSSLVLTNGQSASCSITNSDQAATLTLTKTVSNTHGGTKTISDFPLTATGPTTITGVSGTAAVTSASVNAGTYTLSEPAVAGYTAGSWSCTAGTLTGSSLVLGNGQTATCSITNSDQAAILTLTKTVSNTHGGTATVSSFPLKATGPTTINGVSGTAAVTSAPVSAGTYTLSETTVAGYTASSWSCTAGTLTGSSLVLTNGQSATCSITNSDQASTLTLTKTVNNAHGGTKTISDFPLTATGPTTITGVSGTAAVTSASVNAGTYALSEPTVAGYTAGSWSCTAGTLTGSSLVLGNGQTATCSIINSDQSATLTLTKTVSNTHGGAKTVSDFPLTATGPTTISGVSGTAAVTSAPVSAGTYTLSEPTVAGYTAGSWSCTAGTLAGNSLVLANGQTATCSITNSDQAATLTLTKTVSNTRGGTKTISDFPLTATGPTTISGVSGTAAVTNASVNAGTYTLSEPTVAGYTAGSWSCTAGTLTGNSLVLTNGQSATCSITNSDQAATLTLTKTVSNTHGGTKTISDFPLTATGPTTITGISGTAAVTSASVNAGTYTLSEAAVTGYTAGAWSCTAGTLTGNSLVLANGQTATCSITNSDQAATLTLKKTVNNTHGGTATVSSFPLTATGSTTITGVSGTAAVTNASVNAGTYTLSEPAVAGYTAGSWSCTAGTLTGNSLVLSNGQNATCSITNSDQASTLTLTKTVSNTHGGTKTISDFPLTATGPTTIAGVSGTAAVTSASVNAGTYTLSEPTVAGYSAGSWNCTAGTLTGNSLVLGSGQTATCSITNSDQASTLTLTKTVSNTHGGAKTISDFPLTATGPTTITGVSGTAAVTSASVNAGTYTLSEPTVAGYTAGSWSCTAGALTGNSLVLANGQTATCSITNSDQAAMLTLTKTVSNTHGGTATVSSFPLKATGSTTISGVSGTAAVTNAPVSAGTYTLSETTTAGYTASSWSCSINASSAVTGSSVTLNNGDSASCSITNSDQASTLTLTKTVSNTHGGTKTISDFPLTATGPTTISGVSGTVGVTNATVDAGTYALSEPTVPGYAAGAWNCTAGTLTGNSLVLGNGQTATCSITNSDQPATLTLTKTVNNTHGGTKAVSDFPLTATGPTTITGVSGAAAVTSAPVTVGTYTLSEPTVAGYTAGAWSCTAGTLTGNSLVLTNGQSATCSITNTDQAPVLTVVKSVDATTPSPIGANQDAVFDLTVTNTVTGTTASAGYQFYEVVPQNTTFTALSNGTTDCALPAAAGTLCTITVTNPVVAGAPQVLKATFHTSNPLAAGTTSLFNVATQSTTTPPSGCTTSGAVCTTPPTTCAAGDTCASIPTSTAAVTVVKSVDATTPSPIGANQDAVFDLTATNTVTGTTASAGYQFFEIVPQNTTFTTLSNGTTDCALPAAEGTLCTITVTNPIVAGAPQVLKATFHTANPLAAGTTSLFNLATQNTTTPPTGCTATKAVCTTPPTSCPASGATCASVPTSTAAVTVAKSVDATTPSPIGANQDAVFDLTVTNTVTGTTASAGYQFYEVVPQNTTFTTLTNGTTDCALPAAAGTLCTITVTNPIVAAAPQVLKATFHTANPLAAGTTSLFNLATQNTTTPPTGCMATNTLCTTPPTSCPATGATCASVPTSTAAVTVAKSVDATTPSPIGANQDAVFDLTVTNTVTGTMASAGYQFYEVVPQNTTFTAITNGTTDCALPAVASTLCTITVTNPVVAGAPQVLKATFHTINPLAAGTTSIFNVATQNTTAPPAGCTSTKTVCATPPTTCPASGATCASVPTSTAAVTVTKTVDTSTPSPIGANQDAVFNLTVTNTVTGTTEAAGYQFFEVVPQNTTFTAITNGTTDCALPAAAGSLCTITVTNPVVAGAPQVLKATFHTTNPLAAGTTSLFNLATQNTATPPSGCTSSGTICTTPPTTCPASGATCASVPTSTAAVTVAKSVDAATPNPIGANQDAVFDLTVMNTVTGTTASAGYQFFEVVPQNTTFTALSNGTTDCALPVAAGTLCTITVTNPVVAGAPQVLKATFHTANPLAAGTTSLFNVATQSTTTPPTGCTTTKAVCTTPPTTCPASGATCASVPTSTAAVTVAKSVNASTANPIGANQDAVFDLTVTNTVTGTTASAGYQFYEVVPQNTTFTALTNGTTNCALPAAAGTLCTITVTNPVIAGVAQVLKATFHTTNPLAAGTTSLFNLATQNTTTPPSGCTTSGAACTTPPSSCPATGATCASVPTSTAAVTVAKTVDAATPSPIGANQDAVFNLTVTNTVTGTTAAGGYAFYEVVPQNTTFMALTNGTTDCALPAAEGTLCTITVTNPIIAGVPQVLKATFHTANPLAAGTTSLFNLATQNATTPPSGCTSSGAVCTTPPTTCLPSGATCASVPTSTAAVTVAKSVDATTPSPIGANQDAVFDLTVTNTVVGTTANAGYQFFEVVPQNTTFTALTNGTTDCALPATAGTLCTITVTNSIIAGAPQVLKATFHTANPLAAGTTSLFNLATQNTTTPPSGCTSSGTLCTTPPTICPATGATCGSVPTSTAAVTVAKSVDASTPSPIGANQDAVFDLAVTNTVIGTTASAGYQFYEVVPQNTTFTALTNGATDCALPAAAGTLCTITVTNPIVAGAPQVLKATFHTANPLAAGTTSLFNLATQNTTTPPSGCTSSGAVCTMPPTTCLASGATCASVPTSTAAVTVAKSVDATTPSPIGANQDAVFDLTVTNTVAGTTESAGYQFFEVVPQNTTFTALSNGTTDCTLPAAAGTLCTITVTNPVVSGAPQVLKATFHTASPLAAGTTSLFNLATQNTTSPPTGCTATNTVCSTPPTSCPATGATCASVSTSTAALTVVKTVNAATPNPIGANQDAVFDLTVTNTVTGTTEAAGYQFFEVVPQNTMFTALTNGTTNCALPAAAGTLCTITVTNPVVAGTPQVLKATFHTANPLAAGTTSLFNVATQNTTPPLSGCATSGTDCTAPPTTCPATGATCASVPTSTAAVTVVKSVDVATPNPIGANQDAVFDLTVTNTVTGTTESAGYQFYEVVPQNTTFTGLTNGTTDCALPAAAGTLCTVTVTNPVVAGAPQVLKATFHTANPLTAGTTSLFNVATQDTISPPTGCAATNTICTTPPSTCPASGATCASVPTSTAAVIVTKSVDATTPSPIGANQDAVFDLTVTNTVVGTTANAGYQFYEVVPQNTTFTALTNGTTDCSLPAAAGTLCTITVTNPIVAAAPQVLKATFHTVNPLAAGTTSIFNVATQNTTSPPTGCMATDTVCTAPPSTCPATNATCASVPTSTSAVTVVKSVDAATPSPISANQDAVFDLTVTNTIVGTTANAGYQFFEVVPQNTTFTALTSGTTDCTLPAAAGTLCTITVTNPVVSGSPQVLKATFHTANPLAAGTTSLFNVATQDTTSPPTGCTATNTVCTTPPTSCPATNATCASVPATQADLQAAGPTNVTGTIGTPVTVTTTCTNAGPNAGENASCVVSFPGGTPTGAVTTCTPNPVPNPLSVSGTITCQTTFTPTSAGTVQIVTTAGSTTPDPNPSNNTATTDVVTSSSAAVTTVKTLDASTSTPIVAAQLITYDLTATNTGGTTVTSYTINEVVPANTTFVSVASGTTTATSSCTGGEAAGTVCPVSFTSVPAEVGATPGVASVKVTFKAASSIPDGTQSVANSITEPSSCTGATCTTPPLPNGCSASPCTPVISCPANDPLCVQVSVMQADMQASAPTTATGTIGTPTTVTTTCTNAGPDPAVNATCMVTGAPPGATTICTPSVPVTHLAVSGVITCATTFTPTSAAPVTLVTTAVSDTPDPNAANNTATTVVSAGQITPTPDSATTPYGTPVTVNVTLNDTATGSTINPASVVPTQPAHGAVSCDALGNCTYTPNAGFTGVDTYTYTVCDNFSPPRCGSTTVTIAVGPKANNDTLSTAENTPANGNASSNDTYPPGSTFTVTGNPSHGTVTMNPDGSYTYTPANGYSGTDSFTYTVCEAAPYQALCSTATVAITVASSITDLQANGAPTQTVPVNTPVTVVTRCVNNGPLAAVNATCTVTGIPASAAGTSVPKSGAAAGGAAAGTTCTPTNPVASFAVGAVITCTTTFTPTQVGTYVLPTTVSSDTPESNLTNNTAPSIVIVVAKETPAVPVPVGSRWMLALLGLLLAGGAMLVLRTPLASVKER